MTTKTPLANFEHDAAAVAEEQEQQLRQDLAEAGLDFEYDWAVRELRREAHAATAAVMHARRSGALLEAERENPPSDLDWLSCLRTLIGEARSSLEHEIDQRAAQGVNRANALVKQWRMQRLGRHATIPTRIVIPAVIINGHEWEDR